MIELCSNEVQTTQALVLAPTRELCVQISGDLNRFSDKVKPLNIVPVYGGASISDQIKKIRRGAQIIVATPGRLMDLMERKVIRIELIKFVVLDEADEMLNMDSRKISIRYLQKLLKKRRCGCSQPPCPRKSGRLRRLT
ncbi:MAG: DEAD/DEAH box helicase [Bacteroidota bacterium]